jgi:LPS O-antigen subunit length determinant protein (WzzB/FepE family)
MEQQQSPGARLENKAYPVSHIRDPDEINLLEYFYALVHRKWWIAGLTFVGLIAGLVLAMIKGPVYISEVVIAPKESDSQKAPSLSGLGALGGLVASQLNMSGNASLEKIELILDSREFNAELIQKYKLLPGIYSYEWPKQYKKYWDKARNSWKPEFIPPTPLDIGNFIKVKYLKKTTNKNNTMTIKIALRDSTFSESLATMYADYLNEYIKTNVQNDARGNVTYLEKQIVGIPDPLLREKIQGLIANEIEKQMVVSKEAFRIVDPVYRYKSFKEKKLYPLVFGFGMFFLTCMVFIFIQAISSSEKSDEDRELLERIKHDLFFSSRNRK